MRRRVGVGAIDQHKLQQAKYKNVGTEIQDNLMEKMTQQLDSFREKLEEFATKHKSKIKKNPEFRRQFQEMCAVIGVDPLSSGKGFWSVLGIGDFYYELAVQIVEVCIATSAKNGGLIGLDELRTKLIKARGQGKQHQEISKDDLLCAALKLKIFGSGFAVILVGKNEYMIRSVPGELNQDHGTVLRYLTSNKKCSICVSELCNSEIGWENDRAQLALDQMLEQGLTWIDMQDTEPNYYFPSLFNVES